MDFACELRGMQGTVSDLTKLAMIAVQGWIEAEKLSTKLIMQVHDELVLEVPAGELERVKKKVPELMSGVATLQVPLVAEPGVGGGIGRRRIESPRKLGGLPCET